MPDWIPSLNTLRAFETVARHLSYKSAADELRVTPAAVKQLVAKLEDTLGVKLFERQGHGLVLTPTGMAGKDDLGLAMQHIVEAVGKMRRGSVGTRIIVTVEESFATSWLVPRLGTFRLVHPGIDVLIDSSQHIVDLNHSDVDIAIRYGVPRKEGLISTRLFEGLMVLACSPALAAGPPRLTHIEQLRDVPLIHWDMSHMPWADETQSRFEWEAVLARLGIDGVDTTKGVWYRDYGLAVQAATSNQGMLLAGLPLMQDTFDAGLLVCPFPESTLTTDLEFDVVTSPEAGARYEVDAFIKWIVGVAKRK